MKQHAKPARHERRKPIAEKYQTVIAGTVTIAIITGLVVAFGYGPLAPKPADKSVVRSVMGPR